MKKIALGLVVFAFVFLAFNTNVNTVSATTPASEEGCSGGAVYNYLTGERCTPSHPQDGCQPGFLYSPITGAKCSDDEGEKPVLPPGCITANGYSYLTGQKCVPSYSSVVITGVSGPQSLVAGQPGKWTVSAYGKSDRDLSYSVKWGDEYIAYSANASVVPVYPIQQSATFTHTYNKGGTYYPTFTVSNNYGSESTSLSVKVGEEYCPIGGYNPVTGAICSKGEITPDYMPQGQVGYYYQELFNISGYSSSVAYQYKWSVKKGTLPKGLVLQQTYSATGIVGIPTRAETQTFVISAKSGIEELTKEYTITVKPASKSYDTDGGKNYFVKGETYGTTKCVNQSACTPTLSVDKCDTDILLHEYYIGEDGYKYVEFYYSPTGCKNGAAGSSTQNSIQVLSPNGGETWQIGKTYNIKWTTGRIYCIQAPCVQPSIPETVSIDLVGYDSDMAWDLSIAKSVPNTGSYSWTVPSLTVGAKYKLAIRKAGGGELYDQSDDYFKVTIGTTSGAITVLSPNGGETYAVGDYLKYSVKYSSKTTGNVCHYITTQKELSADRRYISCAYGYQPWSTDASGSVQLDNSFASGNYYWLSTWQNTDGTGYTYDFSDNSFKITSGTTTTPSVKVLSPNGGETWQKGTTQYIKFSGNDIYEITLQNYVPPTTPCPKTAKYCAQPTYAIMNYLLAGAVKYGSFDWKVGWDGSGNEIPDGSYIVQMCKVATNICDTSDSYFQITSNATSDLSITTSSSLPNATAGQYYSVNLLASGGTGFYGWDTGLTAFPVPGLGLSIGNTNCSDSNSALCGKAISSIVGTPGKVYVAGVEQTVPYTFTFNLTLTSGSQSITKKFSLIVNPALPDQDTYSSYGTVRGDESFTFTQRLERGSVGSEVMELQKLLNARGYDAGASDGKFGANTETALIKFQVMNNLKPDGIMGTEVRAILNK